MSTDGIFPGMSIAHAKHGDASAHCVTLNASLWETGPKNYNELGGFQGILANFGSNRGLLEGIGMHCKDMGLKTAMTGAVLNLWKDSPHTDWGQANAVGLWLNSAGTQKANAGIQVTGPWETAFYDGSNSRHVIHVGTDTSHEHFAKINGTYVGSMIDTRGSASPKVLTMRDSQELHWADMNGSGREMSMRMTAVGALQIAAHSWDGNMSFKVQDPNRTTKFQVATSEPNNPVFIYVDGRLRQCVTKNVPGVGDVVGLA